ncbi:MAG: flagellar biosynthetic protein FliO [Rickettsiales bacterium]|nr:flagellar biosynthetic protein FliO [Rickettsiales bacterium]
METVEPSRFVFAFFMVLALIGLMAMVLKYAVASGKFPRVMQQAAGEGRIQVIETRYLDARRKLVLVKRDGVEHLLLLADGRETIIESGILPHA